MPRFFCVGSGFGKQFHIKGDKIQSWKQYFFFFAWSETKQRRSGFQLYALLRTIFFLANLNRIICRSVFDQKQPRKGPHRAPDKRQRALYWGGIILIRFHTWLPYSYVYTAPSSAPHMWDVSNVWSVHNYHEWWRPIICISCVAFIWLTERDYYYFPIYKHRLKLLRCHSKYTLFKLQFNVHTRKKSEILFA